jgi:hypothetical protein
MGEKAMRFSDLSGQLVPDPNVLASITVVDHPDLADGPVRIEALPEELEQLGKFGIRAVTLEVKMPGEEEPTRHVLTTANFAKLATEKPMAEVLDGAERITVKRRVGGSALNGEVAHDHNSLEWAGTPHKGKTSPEEARLVRENLEAINERLIAQGLRPVDPANPEHARRYGFAASLVTEEPQV